MTFNQVIYDKYGTPTQPQSYEAAYYALREVSKVKWYGKFEYQPDFKVKALDCCYIKFIKHHCSTSICTSEISIFHLRHSSGLWLNIREHDTPQRFQVNVPHYKLIPSEYNQFLSIFEDKMNRPISELTFGTMDYIR